MTTTRLLLAAATTAAAAIGVVPAVHGGSAQASGPLTVGDATSTTTLVVPQGAKALTGRLAGSRTVAARTHLTVVRASDGATLFTGSIATFRTLRVAPGARLEVHVERPAAYAGLRADATLAWS